MYSLLWPSILVTESIEVTTTLYRVWSVVMPRIYYSPISFFVFFLSCDVA